MEVKDFELRATSAVLFDVKKYDLTTKSVSDLGFAIYPLCKHWQHRIYLVSGVQ